MTNEEILEQAQGKPTPPPLPPNPKAAFGAQKPSIGLIPGTALAHEAMAFENGAAKYGAYNWRERAVEAMTYVHATLRHLQCYVDGEDYSNDTDPPVLNLAHARACLGILIDAMEQGNLIDNRPPHGRSSEVQDRLKAAKVEAARGK